MVRYNTLAPASDCVLPTAFYFGTLVDSTCVDIVLAINDRSHYARTRASGWCERVVIAFNEFDYSGHAHARIRAACERPSISAISYVMTKLMLNDDKCNYSVATRGHMSPIAISP